MGTGYSLAHLSAGPLSPRNPTSHTVHLCDARPAGRGAHCPAVFVCVAHLALEMTALFILFERIPPQASLAHILSGSCAGNKEEARHFMRKLDKHTARATARVERAAPDSKDTATSLRRADKLEGPKYAARRAELRRKAGERKREQKGAAGGDAVAGRGRGERSDRGRSDKRENDESGTTARWHEG